MKRARIKAMVTVPARRKVAQDASVTENTTPVQHNNENRKSISDTVCVTLEKDLEDNSQGKEIQEDVEIEEQAQNEEVHTSQESNESEAKSIQSSEDLKKTTAQVSETLNKILTGSPVKLMQNRSSFVKPTPKFDSGGRIRRNSTQGSGASASESEDDNRKVTNSTSINNANQSTKNVKDVTVNTNSTKNNVTTTNVGQKRRILISESARKLAEARREFHLRNENKTPDRSKLTMYDLIYYNPVTNPMKKSKESGLTTRRLLESPPEEIQEEEAEDDPSSAMPVPQVKVGPNGQLIIDEQSLVIEQTNAKKSREVLSKEVIIDDDNGNGFYKRRKKSKEWAKWETLKFYKALNTVGTDFLLMQSLFPNRTRQEIKLKFKKEEKVNRNLVEKALAYHQEFDIETLEKSLAIFENLEKVQSKAEKKPKQQGPKERKRKNIRQRRKSRLVAATIEEMDESDEDVECDSSKVLDEKRETNSDREQTLNASVANKKADKRPREEEQLSVSETDDSVSLSSWNDCDSDMEVYRVRPTRSGRIPKIKKLQGPDINTLDNETRCVHDPDNEEHKEVVSPSEDDTNIPETIVFNDSNIDTDSEHPASLKSVIPNIGEVKPGSLVILSKESLEEPGESVLQVYMVSSDVNSEDLRATNMTPVNISSELLATVTAKLPDIKSVSPKEECE